MNKSEPDSTIKGLSAGISEAYKSPLADAPKTQDRTLTSNTAIAGLILLLSGSSLFIYMLLHENDYVFFAEWAAFGLYILAPLGLIVTTIGVFMPTFGKRSKVIEDAKAYNRQGRSEFNGHAVPFGKAVNKTGEHGEAIPYPYIVDGAIQPKSFINPLPIYTLCLIVYLMLAYYSIIYEHSYTLAVVFFGLPIVITLYALFAVKPYLQTRSMEVSEPELPLYKKAFYKDIADVIRSIQGGTRAQAENAAQLCTKKQREEIIDKIFDDQNTALHVPLYIEPDRTPHKFRFDVSRGLRLMPPLDREMLRAVLHLYNYDYISHEGYKYFMATILAAGNQGSIKKYHEKVSNNDIYEKYLKLSDLPTRQSRAFYLIENVLGWRHNEALSDVLQLVDGFIESHPDNLIVKKVYDMIHSGGKWLTSADIPGSNYENKDNSKYVLNLGTLEDGTPLGFSQDGSLMTIGGAGSGKTQCLVIPNLLTWAGSSIVLDVKPELWDKTAGYREKSFGSVYKLDFTSDTSQQFSPFEYISDDPLQVFGDTLFFANLIVPPSVNAAGNDKFWEDSARNIIQAFLIAMVTERTETMKTSGTVKPPALSLTELIRMIVNREALESAIYLLSGSEIELCRLLGESIDSLLIQPEKNGSNVLSGVLNQLWTQMQPLLNPRIENMAQRCDWTPDDLRQQNATLYIVLAPGQVAEYAPLLRLILGVHLREYLALSEDDAKKRPPMLLMFDEMPQLGYMQAIEQAIEMGRSKGIKLWGFLQRLGQLEEQYKDARGFLGNCKAQLYLSPSTEDGTAKMVSDALGTRQDLGGGQQVPLAEPAALAGAEYKDKIVITGQGETPAKVSRDWAYLNDEFQQRMKIPPPNDPKI